MAQRTTDAIEQRPAVARPRNGGAVSVAMPRKPRRDPVETIWTLFCSVRFAVVLNVALALVAMLGTVVPQMQPGTQTFPTELTTFLDQAKTRYGDLTTPLYWAGFFDLFNSLPFRILVVLVVFSIIMCTMNRWGPIVRLVFHPVVRVSDTFIGGLSEKAQFRSVPISSETAETAVRAALKRGRYRILAENSGESGEVLHLYADRDRWSKFVTFVSHAALVALILVAAGMASFGWREQSVFFYPGEPVDVGHGLPFVVRNDHFSIDYYPDGTTIKEYKDTLAVVQGGKDVFTKTIVVNDPLRYQGVNYFLVSYQPIVFAKVTDNNGQVATLRRMGQTGPITDTTKTGETLAKFTFTSSDNLPMDLMQLPVKDHILTLQMTYYQDVARNPGENPPLYVKAYVDKNFDSTIYDAFIPRTGVLKIPGYEQYNFTFRPDTATVLEVAKDPGLTPIVTLFVIMTAGFAASLYTTFTRCWAKISPSEERPGAVTITLGGLAEKNKVTFERDFERLATRARDGLSAAVSGGDIEAAVKKSVVEPVD